MIKTLSKLNSKEKEIINKGILYMIILFILFTSYRAYVVYDTYGFQSCIIETDSFTGDNKTICFDNSKERNEYLQLKNYPKNLAQKYINNYTNITFVD